MNGLTSSMQVGLKGSTGGVITAGFHVLYSIFSSFQIFLTGGPSMVLIYNRGGARGRLDGVKAVLSEIFGSYSTLKTIF